MLGTFLGESLGRGPLGAGDEPGALRLRAVTIGYGLLEPVAEAVLYMVVDARADGVRSMIRLDDP